MNEPQPIETLDRATHRALVEAGYAPLSGYVERFGDHGHPDDGKHAHIALPALLVGCVAFWGWVGWLAFG